MKIRHTAASPQPSLWTLKTKVDSKAPLRLRRRIRTKCIWLGCTMLALIAHSATAKAVRPGVNTETALRRLKMSMPIELRAVVDQNQFGIDFEDAETRKAIQRQVSEYLDLRQGGLSESKWQKICRKDDAARIENPFCAFEEERRGRTRIAKASATTRAAKRSIATSLKAGNFDGLANRPYQEVIGGVAALGEFSMITEVAKRALDHQSCLPSNVSYALGYKLEEGFPDPGLVAMSKKLYRKSVDCGNDTPAATSSFRLGLIEIWQHDCHDIRDLMLKTEKTPGAAPFHARAKYWRYYCAGQLKDDVAQRDARDSLLRDHPLSFQNLAVNGGDTTGLLQVMRPIDPQVAFRSLVRPELNAVLRGAEALLRLDAKSIATEMIDHRISSINEMEPEVRLYAAILLNRMGSALPKFKILSNLFDEAPRTISASTMKLYFPLWYFDLVKRKETEIDPLLILSLIRQESAFNKEARSVVGARGLMQIMPATARGMSRSRARDLFDPQTNISLGTTYLLKRLHQYGGDVELTLAAYNAGFGRVDDWRKRYPTENKMLFLDFIPFRETRDYVSMILRNYYWYVRLYDQTPDRGIASVQAHPSGVDQSTLTPLSNPLAQEVRSLRAIATELNQDIKTQVPAPAAHHPGPKTSAIMSANAGLAAGVLAAP